MLKNNTVISLFGVFAAKNVAKSTILRGLSRGFQERVKPKDVENADSDELLKRKGKLTLKKLSPDCYLKTKDLN